MPDDVSLAGVLGSSPERRPIVLRLFESLPGTYPGTYKRNVIVWLVYLLVTMVVTGILLETI